MKKLTSLLLAVLMLSLPILSLADASGFLTDAYLAGKAVRTDITFEVPEDSMLSEPSLSPVKDLLNTLSFHSTTRGGDAFASDFSMRLKNKDGLTLHMEHAADGLRFASNLLGDKVMLLNEQENLVLTKLLAPLAQDNTDAMLAMLNSWSTMDFRKTGHQPTEQQLAAIKQYVTEEAVSVDDGKHDAAVKQYSFNLNGKQIIELSKQFGADTTILDKQADQIDKLTISGKFLSDDKDDLVFAEMTVNPPPMSKTDCSETVESPSMLIQFARKTGDAGIAYALEMKAETVDTPVISGTLLDQDGNLTGSFVVRQEKETMLTADLTRKVEKTETSEQSVTTIKLDLIGMPVQLQIASTSTKDGDDVDFASLAKISLMNSAFANIKVQSTTKDATVPALDDSKIVHLSQMDDAALETFKSEVEKSAKLAATALTQKLPASLLKMLIPGK